MSTLSSTSFFTQMLSHCKKQNSKSMLSTLKNLFDNGDSYSKQSWVPQFDFEPQVSIDNMAGTYFNMLQALQQWQIERLTINQTTNTFFDSYLVLLELCLTYLDNMSKNNQWLAPAIKYLVMKSKYVLNQYKKRETNEIKTNKSLERLIQQLRDFKSSNSIDQDIKKSFQLMINNLLVSCYLSIRDYTKSRNIVEDKGIQRDINTFNINEINNYYFQAARCQISAKLFTKAIKSLQSIKFTTNRQRKLILKYLIPCNLYAWKVTTSKIFPQYNLLSEAIISGNLAEFNKIVNDYKMLWIKRGMFELIIGLETILWRNFIKRIQKILDVETLPINQIAVAARLMGVDIDAEECLFRVTNLIKKDYVKGHIYLTGDNQKTLVFRIKKGDVFPKSLPQ